MDSTVVYDLNVGGNGNIMVSSLDHQSMNKGPDKISICHRKDSSSNGGLNDFNNATSLGSSLHQFKDTLSKPGEISVNDFAIYLVGRYPNFEMISKSGVGKESIFYQATKHFLNRTDPGFTRKWYLRWKNNYQGIKDIFMSLGGVKSTSKPKPPDRTKRCHWRQLISEQSLFAALQKLEISVQSLSESDVYKKTLWIRIHKEIGCQNTNKNRLCARRVWGRFKKKQILNSTETKKLCHDINLQPESNDTRSDTNVADAIYSDICDNRLELEYGGNTLGINTNNADANHSDICDNKIKVQYEGNNTNNTDAIHNDICDCRIQLQCEGNHLNNDSSVTSDLKDCDNLSLLRSNLDYPTLDKDLQTSRDLKIGFWCETCQCWLHYPFSESHVPVDVIRSKEHQFWCPLCSQWKSNTYL